MGNRLNTCHTQPFVPCRYARSAMTLLQLGDIMACPFYGLLES